MANFRVTLNGEKNSVWDKFFFQEGPKHLPHNTRTKYNCNLTLRAEEVWALLQEIANNPDHPNGNDFHGEYVPTPYLTKKCALPGFILYEVGVKAHRDWQDNNSSKKNNIELKFIKQTPSVYDIKTALAAAVDGDSLIMNIHLTLDENVKEGRYLGMFSLLVNSFIKECNKSTTALLFNSNRYNFTLVPSYKLVNDLSSTYAHRAFLAKNPAPRVMPAIANTPLFRIVASAGAAPLASGRASVSIAPWAHLAAKPSVPVANVAAAPAPGSRSGN